MLRPEQNGWYSTGDILKWIFAKAKSLYCDLSVIKFVPKGPIDDKSALDQVMA